MFVQRWVKYNVDRESTDTDDLNVIKARHEVVKTQKTELEVGRMSGRLIEVSDVKNLWRFVAATVTQNVLHLPHKVAPMLLMMENPEEISAVIDTEVRAILESLSETPLPDYVEDSE